MFLSLKCSIMCKWYCIYLNKKATATLLWNDIILLSIHNSPTLYMEKKPKACFSVLHTTFAHYTFPNHSHLKACLESPQIVLLKLEIVTTLHFHKSAFIICLEILMHTMPSLMLTEKKKINYNNTSFWDASFQYQGLETVSFPQPPHTTFKLCRNKDLSISWLSYSPQCV